MRCDNRCRRRYASYASTGGRLKSATVVCVDIVLLEVHFLVHLPDLHRVRVLVVLAAAIEQSVVLFDRDAPELVLELDATFDGHPANQARQREHAVVGKARSRPTGPAHLGDTGDAAEG